MYQINKFKIKKPLALFALMFSLPLSAEEIKVSDHLFSSFINDSHADLSFRNVFKNLSTEDYGERSIQTAWGQGITLDYQSGYFADMLGVDASYYGVIKLAASDDFWGRSVLYNDNGQAKRFQQDWSALPERAFG
ncbi:putative outer membrane porin protein [Serratia fonticola]|uniref:Putative outer membrane porin protein n=1 Tax=Serratia fonticola TaxID=47917 RepID=A0A4U9U007_SERFO|nr:putative outer membrane porin protein [Serratia fonticola]